MESIRKYLGLGSNQGTSDSSTSPSSEESRVEDVAERSLPPPPSSQAPAPLSSSGSLGRERKVSKSETKSSVGNRPGGSSEAPSLLISPSKEKKPKQIDFESLSQTRLSKTENRNRSPNHSPRADEEDDFSTLARSRVSQSEGGLRKRDKKSSPRAEEEDDFSTLARSRVSQSEGGRRKRDKKNPNDFSPILSLKSSHSEARRPRSSSQSSSSYLESGSEDGFHVLSDEQYITTGLDSDLTDWPGGQMSPFFFSVFAHSLKGDVERLKEIEQGIQERNLKRRVCEKFLTFIGALKGTRKEIKKQLKERKEILSLVKSNLEIVEIERLISLITDTHSLIECLKTEDKAVLGVLVKKFREKSTEKIWESLKKIKAEGGKPDDLITLMLWIQKAYSCYLERRAGIQTLEIELICLERCLKLETLENLSFDLQEIQATLEEEIDRLIAQRREIDKRFKSQFSEQAFLKGVEVEAQRHLDNGTFPDKPKSDDKRKMLHADAVFSEMLKRALAAKGPNDEPNDAVAESDGSGEVNYIFNRAPGVQGREEISVFKPRDGAPGMPGNRKGQTPEALEVYGDRSLMPGRIGFPPNKTNEREYAPVLLGFPCHRTLVTLTPFSKSNVEMKGFAIRFIKNIGTLGKLFEYVVYEFLENRLSKIEVEIGRLQMSGELDQTKIQLLEKEKKGLEKSLEDQRKKVTLPMSDKRRLFAKTFCKDLVEKPTKIHQLPWQRFTKRSLHTLLAYSLVAPNFDINEGNLLVNVSDEKDLQGDPLFEVDFIDTDQGFSDTWGPINTAAWYNSLACDFPLKDSDIIFQVLKEANVQKMLLKLLRGGVRFSLVPEEILVWENDQVKVYTVGGDLEEIWECFLRTAKMATIMGCSANHVAKLTSIGSPLYFAVVHQLLLKAKEAVREERYSEIVNHEEYKKLKANPLYMEFGLHLEKKSHWDFFELYVFERLNKLKSEKSS